MGFLWELVVARIKPVRFLSLIQSNIDTLVLAARPKCSMPATGQKNVLYAGYILLITSENGENF